MHLQVKLFWNQNPVKLNINYLFTTDLKNRETVIAVLRKITLIVHKLQNNRTVGTVFSSHIISSPIPYRTVERRGHSFLHTSFFLASMISLRTSGAIFPWEVIPIQFKKNSQAEAAELHNLRIPQFSHSLLKRGER